MNLERNFGASSVREDIPYNLEGYGNESVREFAEIDSPLDRIISESLGLPPDCPAEARIWQFKKDPWQFYSDSGQLLFTLDRLRFTIFKSGDFDGGKRCHVILCFEWTNQRKEGIYLNKPEIPMIIRTVNDEGECLLQWDLGKLLPQSDWIRRPMSFMQDIDPDNYEKITGISWHLFFGKGRLYEC